MYNYYLAYDDGNMLIRSGLGLPIQRYDKVKRDWITDWDLAVIYFGKIPVDSISEEEAKKWML